MLMRLGHVGQGDWWYAANGLGWCDAWVPRGAAGQLETCSALQGTREGMHVFMPQSFGRHQICAYPRVFLEYVHYVHA